MEESTREELDRDQAENKESIIAKVQKFMQDGWGCCQGLKSGQCSDQFTEETIHGISKSRFQWLVEHYQSRCISLHIHENSKGLPHNTLPLAINKDVKNFLGNYVRTAQN